MRTAVVFLFAMGLSVAAPVPKAFKNKSDAALLEGKWVSVTIDQGEGVKPYAGVCITFHDGKMTQEWKDSQTTGRIAIDETATPKQVDVIFPDDRKQWEQIYHLDGDTLTLCRGRTKSGRVTEFKGSGSSPCLVLKRVKE